MSPLPRYFDLTSRDRQPRARSDAPKHAPWMPQYLALLLGILVQPFFAEFQSTGNWSFAGFGGWVFGSVIIAICIFPSVYRSALDPDRPIFVQFCLIFVAGMGWQSLFQTALDAL